MTKAAHPNSVEGLSVRQITALYNDLADELGRPRVKKLTDKNSAVRRYEAIRAEYDNLTEVNDQANEEAMATEYEPVEEGEAVTEEVVEEAEEAEEATEEATEEEAEEAEEATEEEAEEAEEATEEEVKPKKGKPGRRGRSGKFNGTILYATVKDNVHRPGTKSYNALQLIIDAGEEGIPFEEWLAHPHQRMNTLRGNVRWGVVKFVDPRAPTPPVADEEEEEEVEEATEEVAEEATEEVAEEATEETTEDE
jgi:hypothetical protein